jgi:flagellar motor switch protein FliN
VTILEASPSITKFIETWRRNFTQVLTESGLRAPKVEAVDAKSCADKIAKMEQKHYCVVLNGGGKLKGTLRLLMSEAEALQLSLVRPPEGAKPSPQPGEAQHGAAAELIGRATAGVAATWGAGAVKLEIAPAVVDDAKPESICGGLRITAESFAAITVVLGPSADFAESLRVLEGGAAAAGAGDKKPVTSTALANQPRGSSSNLDLLFDVQLEATIRFGGRELLLRDILSMSAGSVIGLDRQVDEPAELLVAGRLVARGEVVVVEGNFGLRITEVTSANQRSELLHA